MLISGCLTAAIIGAVLRWQRIIMDYSTRGGKYAVLPIAAVAIAAPVFYWFARTLWAVCGLGQKQPDDTDELKQPPYHLL